MLPVTGIVIEPPQQKGPYEKHLGAFARAGSDPGVCGRDRGLLAVARNSFPLLPERHLPALSTLEIAPAPRSSASGMERRACELAKLPWYSR